MSHAISDTAPLFTIAHNVKIAATAEEVWAVLCDFEHYGEWNPYVLAISGDLVAGGLLTITIAQSNWPKPLTIQPTLIRAEPPHVLHWQGRIGEGVLDTDHSFEIEPLGEQQVRFLQQEEFRGSLAEGMEDDAREFTHEAFRAMNEALSKRVQATRTKDPTTR